MQFQPTAKDEWYYQKKKKKKDEWLGIRSGFGFKLKN